MNLLGIEKIIPLIYTIVIGSLLKYLIWYNFYVDVFKDYLSIWSIAYYIFMPLTAMFLKIIIIYNSNTATAFLPSKEHTQPVKTKKKKETLT